MVLTNKQKFNRKYGFKRDEGHSLNEIAKLTKIKKSILQQVYNRGVGARKTNPESVRQVGTGKKIGGKSLKGKMSANAWAFARVYGFVMKNPKQIAEGKPDHDLFKKLSNLML
jgi:hypothetical protein